MLFRERGEHLDVATNVPSEQTWENLDTGHLHLVRWTCCVRNWAGDQKSGFTTRVLLYEQHCPHSDHVRHVVLAW